jgi:hypothetical protein
MIFKMQDGRAFTDFTPSCALNALLQNKYKTSNSHEYRYYLQRNADAIHHEFLRTASKGTDVCEGCPVCSQAVNWKPEASSNTM